MTKDSLSSLNIAFFGTPDFAVFVLEELEKAGISPKLVVTAPDKPKGRGLVLTPPPAKSWAAARGISVIQPATLRDPKVAADLAERRWDLFIVCAYGKIIPESILELPLHRSLNVHPSLLPKYRGPSPIQSAILSDDRETGVSIMLLDQEVDHGPVLASEKLSIPASAWPLPVSELEERLARAGGALLAEVVPKWVDRAIEAVPQEHHKATFTKKIEKEDGLVDLSGDPYQNFLKIQAFKEWPGAYFFVDKKDPRTGEAKKIRVSIKEARFEGKKSEGSLVITKVVPEGKKEMDYQSFLNGLRS